MNPPDQPTQPTEAHKELAEEIRHIHRKGFPQLVPRLLADSEARAVEAATVQLRSELNYAKASETLYHAEGTAALAALAAEREKVRVLRGALEKVQHIGETELLHYAGMHGDSPHQVAYIAKAALAATEGKT
jgi:hypothetical protein